MSDDSDMVTARHAPMYRAEIEKNFKHHPPKTQDIAAAHESIRQLFKDLAHSVDALCPNSREKALVLTNLEQALMWANAAIARNQA